MKIILWRAARHEAAEGTSVPGRSDPLDRWGEMEVADCVSFAQWNQTLRRVTAAHPSCHPADAHHAIAGVRTDGDTSSTGLCPGPSKGRIFAHGAGTEFRANHPPDLCVGGVVLQSEWHGALAHER